MATHHTPRGVYSRPSPDFFEHESASIGVVTSAAGGFPSYVALYNNDPQSRLFRVFKIVLSTSDAAGVAANAFSGSRGTVGPVALPKRFDLPQPPGVCNFSSSLSPFTGPLKIGFQHPLGTTAFTLDYNAALWVIPPGWSLEFQTITVNQTLRVTFWYTFLRAP